MNYYSHHIGDYRRDTAHLSLLEHGIYRQLLDQYYLNEEPICPDDAKLMRSLCVRNADEMRALENVLADFFSKTDLGYVHKRCDVEIAAFHAKSASARESAKARWSKVKFERDANAFETQSEGNANHKPITNNHKPINNKENNKKKKEEIDFYGVPENIIQDFQKLRKAKKAPITQTAVNRLKAQSDKAGISLADALTLCCSRGWMGFEAEWLVNDVDSGKSNWCWWGSDASIIAKGVELKMSPNAGERTPDFKARIQAAIDNGGKPPPVKRNPINTIIPSESRNPKPIHIPELKSLIKNRDPPL